MEEYKKIKIGVIADDFTGASDAASFLSKGGARTIMLNNILHDFNFDCDAIVIALKTRSVSPNEAIRQTKCAVDFLMKINCEKIYFKYCSTFDSTPIGNIGVVGDFLMEYLGVTYTVLCPSLPVNGRQVKDGVLYVDGVELSESPLKNHPVNPMWDSYIPTLMKNQSKYACYIINNNVLSNELDDRIKELKEYNEHFYLIPDYIDDKDGLFIAQKFRNLKLLTGGSGLLEFIIDWDKLNHRNLVKQKNIEQRSIILCGSCSKKTRQQVQFYKKCGGDIYPIDAFKLLDDSLTMEMLLEYIVKQKNTVLVYSDAIDRNMSDLRKRKDFKKASHKLECVMSELSKAILDYGYSRIIVGGGETSGAVMKTLGFEGFYIGESINPGVPELIPIQNQDVSLILKSGNFGSEDFFIKAIRGDSCV